jgi:hypothetical protein
VRSGRRLRFVRQRPGRALPVAVPVRVRDCAPCSPSRKPVIKLVPVPPDPDCEQLSAAFVVPASAAQAEHPRRKLELLCTHCCVLYVGHANTWSATGAEDCGWRLVLEGAERDLWVGAVGAVTVVLTCCSRTARPAVRVILSLPSSCPPCPTRSCCGFCMCLAVVDLTFCCWTWTPLRMYVVVLTQAAQAMSWHFMSKQLQRSFPPTPPLRSQTMLCADRRRGECVW